MSRSNQSIKLPEVDLLYLAEKTTEYILHEGFESVRYKGGSYYRKPGTLVHSPQYIRFAFRTGQMDIEAFMKWTLFPGLHVGEMGITGSFCEERKTLLVRSVNNLVTHTKKLVEDFLEQNPGRNYPKVRCTIL